MTKITSKNKKPKIYIRLFQNGEREVKSTKIT